MVKLMTKEPKAKKVTKKKVVKEVTDITIEEDVKVTPVKVEEVVEETVEMSTELTPEQQWELSVKEKINEYIDNLLSVSKECNMGTRYFNPVMEVYETHTDYYEDRTNGAELRIVFAFAEDLNLKDMKFT